MAAVLPTQHMIHVQLLRYKHAAAHLNLSKVRTSLLRSRKMSQPLSLQETKADTQRQRRMLHCGAAALLAACCMDPGTDQHAPWDSTAGGGASPSFEPRYRLLPADGLLAKALALACCPPSCQH
jgi:hypothetical protein